MGRLIRLQLRNIFQGKLLYICLLLAILLGPIVTFLLELAFSDTGLKTTVFDQILSLLSIGIVETIFIALVSCNDFSEGTTKNIIGRGYTRTQLIFSKYIAIFISLMFMYLINILVTFLLLSKNGIGYESIMSYELINSFVGIIAFIVFYTTMAFILEKNGSAILACLFVPQIISTILMVIDSVTHVEVSKYWIDHGSEVFLDKPTLGNLGLSILYYVIYIVIFIIIGIQVLKRKEIK